MLYNPFVRKRILILYKLNIKKETLMTHSVSEEKSEREPTEDLIAEDILRQTTSIIRTSISGSRNGLSLMMTRTWK